MNAPEPTFTSSTSAAAPSAIFLLMIELAISGIDSTVAGHVAQRVQLAVGRCELGTGGADHRADLAQLGEELGVGQLGPPARDRFQLVQGAAGVAESAPGQLRHGGAARGDQRRQRQRDLVADAAGGVLVGRRAGHAGQVEPLARGDHRRRPTGQLVGLHARSAGSPWPARPSARRRPPRGCRRRSPSRSARRESGRRRAWCGSPRRPSKGFARHENAPAGRQPRSSRPKARGRTSIISRARRRCRPAGRARPCSHSSCRHRPHGISTPPWMSTHANATSRPPPRRVQGRHQPALGAQASPYEAFSTLQPDDRPDRRRPGRPHRPETASTARTRCPSPREPPGATRPSRSSSSLMAPPAHRVRLAVRRGRSDPADEAGHREQCRDVGQASAAGSSRSGRRPGTAGSAAGRRSRTASAAKTAPMGVQRPKMTAASAMKPLPADMFSWNVPDAPEPRTRNAPPRPAISAGDAAPPGTGCGGR